MVSEKDLRTLRAAAVKAALDGDADKARNLTAIAKMAEKDTQDDAATEQDE